MQYARHRPPFARPTASPPPIPTHLAVASSSPTGSPEPGQSIRRLLPGIPIAAALPAGPRAPAWADPSSASWEQFLLDQVHILLPNNPLNRVNAAVQRFTTTAELALINPRLAGVYFQECSRR